MKNIFEFAKREKAAVPVNHNDDYAIQWEMNYGRNPLYGARYEVL